MKTSLSLFATFVLGIFIALYGLLPEVIISSDYVEWVLNILLFLIGFGLGSDEKILKKIKGHQKTVFIITSGTILGTIIGSAASILLIKDFDLKEIIAVGSGFGYYSLSSVLISNMHSDVLGTVALLSNLLREILTLLLAPIIGKLFGKYAIIMSGGATSMDTTLPVVIKFSGKDLSIISIVHGFLLTLLVPILVTLLLS
jgi:uncharacterized membrane protein YbjE (DUF340 family)